MAAPDSADKTKVLVLELMARMQRGHVMAIHCRGGVGRAGTIAACLLLELGRCKGMARTAIAEVRNRRCPQAVETRRQEEFIFKYADNLRNRLLVEEERKKIVSEKKTSSFLSENTCKASESQGNKDNKEATTVFKSAKERIAERSRRDVEKEAEKKRLASNAQENSGSDMHGGLDERDLYGTF